MMRYALFVVEGPHDVELLAAILGRYDLKRRRLTSEVPPFWTRTIPRKFPHGDDLLKRVPVPTFFGNDDFSVGVMTAGGITNVVKTTSVLINNLESPLDGLGVLLDADDAFATTWNEFFALQNDEGLPFGAVAGLVSGSSPAVGAFVLPNNNDDGALEKLTLQCGAICYPDLIGLATTFVDTAADSADLRDRDRREINRPRVKEKAIAAAVANVLKPGKALQMSLQDNEWFKSDKSRHVLTDVEVFVCRIVGLV